MSETWPLRGTGLDALQILQWNQTINRRAGGPIWSWTLSTVIMGEEYLNQMGTDCTWVEEIKCKSPSL